ncbi:hypothetical protein WJX81_006554 [Elliptochloris bilobata]|uniref:Uncharacterized protein n=1 Tax=Elliptochloris bilobata TaxID=381761 RepID=A0AAW1RLD6_9CHLO
MGAVASCLAGHGRQLLAAGYIGDAGTVQEVLEAKPELASFTFFNYSMNVMHYAAERGHVGVLRAVVETLLSSALDCADASTGTSHIVSAKAGALSWSRFLKDHVINACNAHGQTPLILACEQGRAECVAYLLSLGADALAVDDAQRRNALHHASAGSHVAALKALLSDATRMHTEEGSLPLRNVRVLDMSGQCRYIDSRAENGLTAMHIAAAVGSLGCVRALLGAGASLMVRTVDLDMPSLLTCPPGSTPLHLAAQHGHVSILQAMLQAQADALGTWGNPDPTASSPGDPPARRAWEGDGRIDLRSVADATRLLPYHVAWGRGHRAAAGLLNPTVNIDTALETAREHDQGFGPQRLATLAAHALRRDLLQWLEIFKVKKEAAACMRARRKATAAERPSQTGSEEASGAHLIARRRSLAASQRRFSVESIDKEPVADEAATHVCASSLRVAQRGPGDISCRNLGVAPPVVRIAHTLASSPDRNYSLPVSVAAAGGLATLRPSLPPCSVSAQLADLDGKAAGRTGLSRSLSVSFGLSRVSGISLRQTLSSLRRVAGGKGPAPAAEAKIYRAASIVGFNDCQDEDCGICLDQPLDVAVRGCRHRLCIDCALRLERASGSLPAVPARTLEQTRVTLTHLGAATWGCMTVVLLSLHSECVVNVSGSKHIKESLMRFGVSPECKHLLVARFDSTLADLETARRLVKGTQTALAELPSLTNSALVAKLYKLAPQELKVGSCVDAILSRIAARDC